MDYTPIYDGGHKPFSATTSAAVTGGRVLAISGNGTVAHAGAASTVACGVAAHDAASGAKVTMWPLEGVIHELQAASAITAAGGVQTAANGEVDPVATSIAAGSAAGTLIGAAATTAAGSPLKLRVQGRR
ncbi:MAG: capsid cement protein [Nocardioidaceae bacterium]